MQRSNSTTGNNNNTNNNNAAASSNKFLIVLTNEAFIRHKSRWEEEQDNAQRQQNCETRDPRSHCKAFTGVDVYELAYLWIALTKKANIQVDLASPWGGAVPSDPDSLSRLMKDEELLRQFRRSNDFITMIDHTFPINSIHPHEYKAAIVIGSYGSMFDLPSCSKIQQVLTSIYENNGYLCTIGHGAAVLANLQDPTSGKSSNSRYLINNKKIACPTNREEKERRYERILPFLLEDRLKERGAKIQESDPFKPNVVIDERLITAQNATSIRDFIRKIGEKALNKSIEI